MAIYEFTIQVGDTESFRMHLDEELMTQGIMASYFASDTFYEPESTEILQSILKSGSTFVDVGAHVGWFSLVASRLVGPEGMVFSFEPDRKNFIQLLNHIELNQCDNIIPNFMAVSSSSGVRTFHINSDNDGGHALYDPSPFPFNEKTRLSPKNNRVMSTSLDDVLPYHLDIDLLKIDTEGAEYSVLAGAEEFLRTGSIKNVLAEINIPGLIQMGHTESDLRKFMDELGYRSQDISKTDNPNAVYNVLFNLE